MADGMALLRVTTNELLHCGQTHAFRAYEGKYSELIPPGPRSRVGTVYSKVGLGVRV